MTKIIPRKASFIFCLTAAVTLTACGSKASEQPKKLPESFSIHADITDGDLSAAADMQRSADGWRMTVTAPETVKGMQFLLSEGGWTLSCDKLSYSAGEEQLPKDSPLRLTARALDGCTRDKQQGKVGSVEYDVSFKKGKPSELVTDSGLKVTFSGYKKTAHS